MDKYRDHRGREYTADQIFMSGISYSGTAGWAAPWSGVDVINHEAARRARANMGDWYKCPFCGRRQNVKEHGAECRGCGGDVMNESVS